MTELEQLMYRILGIISAANTPIVFKGALIKNLVLAEHGYNEIYRETTDIDCNWTATPPSMDILVDTINQSLGDMQNEYYATAERAYGEKKSAGINIISKITDAEVALMDISMKPVIGSRIYYYGETEIRGVLANEILADKISVLSKQIIFRRAKDIIDVYALSHCVKVQTAEIFEIYKNNSSREVGKFAEFLAQRLDVEHAYNKLYGVEGKPPFDEVYSYLVKFVQPFADRDEVSQLWNSDVVAWEEV